MKALIKVLLAISAVANVVLAIVLIRGASESPVNGDAANAAPATSAAAAEAKNTTPSAVQVWAKVDSPDLPELVKRLRAAGFPPNVIRAILAAQIREQFAAQRKALEGDTGAVDFWKNPKPDPQKQAALRDLNRQQQKLLRELLGADADSDSMGFGYRDRGLSVLPGAKADEVRRILRDFDDQRSDVMASLAGSGFLNLTPAEREKLHALDVAQHAEIAKMLTPAELELYDLTASSTAQSLRYRLGAFNPTEDEFRTLFKLQRDFDEKYTPMYGIPTQEEMRARSEAQKQQNDLIKAALGDQRYGDYQRLTDYNYRQTSALVSRLELPPQTADQLYAIQKEFEQRRTDSMQQMRNAMALPPEERRALAKQMTDSMASLQQEAIAKVTPLLKDERGLEAYKQNGGTWLTYLNPRPLTARPTGSAPAQATPPPKS